MSTIFNGDTGITYPDGSTQSNSQVGMKNRIIDGGFIINQRVYTSGTALSSGAYAHDRWKAGSGGCTYTFTQGALGVNTTITITAGSLVQVIEGCNLAEGGTYVLSWVGTAQGRLNGGSYGASGSVTVTGWTAGTNLSVEFNTGTLGSVQLEKGSTATSFDYRPYGTELALCRRYGRIVYAGTGLGGAGATTTSVVQRISFDVQMRSAPTAVIQTSGSWGISDDYAANITATTVTLAAYGSSVDQANLNLGGFTGVTQGRYYGGLLSGTASIFLSSEL